MSSSRLHGDAVLREVRPGLARVPLALMNARALLPEDTWTVHFLHGPRNHEEVRRLPGLAPHIASGSVRLRRYAINGREQGEKLDRHAHFNYQKTLPFWASFAAPWLLLIEPDTVLCPDSQLRLESLYGYAFTGAPWAHDKDGLLPAWCFNLEHCVGNSGLSLWRRDVVAQALAETTFAERARYILLYLKGVERGRKPVRGSPLVRMPGQASVRVLRTWRNATHELPIEALLPTAMHLYNVSGVDTYMSVALQALRHAGRLPIPGVPSAELASRFAVETTYSGNYTPFGMHKAYRYLSAPQLSFHLILRFVLASRTRSST